MIDNLQNERKHYQTMYLTKISYPESIRNFNKQKPNNYIFKNGQTIRTDTSQKINLQLTNILKTITNREMQIKTTMRYHLSCVRMAICKKSKNNRCWWGCGEKRMLVYCWWACKLVVTVESSLELSQRT